MWIILQTLLDNSNATSFWDIILKKLCLHVNFDSKNNVFEWPIIFDHVTFIRLPTPYKDLVKWVCVAPFSMNTPKVRSLGACDELP
jgi:hypothetical protein